MEKTTPTPWQSELEHALSLLQQSQTEKAKALFKQILSQFPNQPDALHGLGMAFAQERDFEQAAFYLKQATEAAPKVAEFHNNLGNAYKNIGNVSLALRHYHEALRLKTPYPQAHNNLGALLYRIGQIEAAASHFQKSIRMDPFAVDTHYNLALCYIQQEKWLEAATHFSEVLKLRPDHLGALHNLGITLCVLKRFEEAKPLLSQVIEREPNNIDALFHLGIIHSALANPQQAKIFYERVLSLNPKHSNTHHNLATIFLHLQEPLKAKAHFEEALKLNPDNETARHMIRALSGEADPQGAPREYTRALFDQYAYSYDEHVKTQLHYQAPALLRQAIAPFVQHKTKPWIVLDLGCGTGLCAPFFADVAEKLIGVDLSPNMIEIARQRGGYYQLHTEDILSFLTRHQETYEMIIAADVFVYFGDLEEVFTACHQRLKPEGLFCFTIEHLPASEEKTYALRQTGRYAHQRQYLHELCHSRFHIKTEKIETLRYQDGAPVEGIVLVLSKQNDSRNGP